MKAIKAMGLERDSWSLMTREATEFRDAQRQTVVAREALKAFYEPLVAVLLAGVFWIVLGVMGASFATLLLVAALFQRLMTRASLLQGHYQSVTANESAFFAVREQIRAARAAAEPLGGRLAPPPLERSLALEAVSFRHGERRILERVDLILEAGGLYAVTGASGAGKSTLVDILLGLRAPDEGRVLIDGVPLAGVEPLAWRHRIGYLPQEPLLFHASVRGNVGLGKADIDDAAIERALELAGAADFVRALPGGLDHVVGERGSTLSGGQRQRLCLAPRAGARAAPAAARRGPPARSTRPPSGESARTWRRCAVA